MKNIVAIMGSPKKKGNTYKAVNNIEEELKKLGNIKLSYIFLQDEDLKMCKGCFVCITKGEDKCPIKDDQKKIEKTMLNADGVIFASPVYGMSVTALFKKFIDRFSYNGHRPRYFNQKALFVLTTGGMGLKDAFHNMSFIEAWGFEIIDKVGIETPPMELTEKYKKKNLNKLKKSAIKFHKALFFDKKRKAVFGHYIGFVAVKTLIKKTPAIYKKSFPADYEYWTKNGWLSGEKKFFYDAKISIFYKIIGSLLGKMMVLAVPKRFKIS
jgi:multimeric flavodoxin WrbA